MFKAEYIYKNYAFSRFDHKTMISSMAPKTSTFFDLKTCHGKSYRHSTRDGVLRIRLGAHQEHQVNHVARATDRTKVSAAVIQLASHEEDSAPQQDMSEGDASDSDGSESASDSEQNDPPSSLVADAEQYSMSSCNVLMLRRVQTSLAKMISLGLSTASFWNGDGSREMAIGKIIFLAADMCGSPRPRASGMLLGSTSFTYYTLCITCLPARGGEMSDHEAGCSLGQRGCGHSQSGSDTWDQEAVQWQYGAFTLLQLLDTADLPGTTALIVPTQCYQGMWKKTTQQWIGTGYSVCQTTQTTEAVGFWHEFQ